MNRIDELGKSIKEFIQTKEFKRFQEFADSVVEYRYIGICHGEAGVGKTLAASFYLKWNESIGKENIVDNLTHESLMRLKDCKGVLITSPVSNTPKIIRHEIIRRIDGYGFAYNKSLGAKELKEIYTDAEKHCPLVIVDEADRLSISSLEEIRDLYDRIHFGLIFIGMPGIEKRFSRYPQLYSRLGFSHEFTKLSEDEMRFIFPKIWEELGYNYKSEYFPMVEAMNAIIRITRGNFRLIDRMFSQINRISKINQLNEITIDVVEAARKCLIFGD